MSSLQRIMILEGRSDRTFSILAKDRHKLDPPALLKNSGYDNKSKDMNSLDVSSFFFSPLLQTYKTLNRSFFLLNMLI